VSETKLREEMMQAVEEYDRSVDQYVAAARRELMTQAEMMGVSDRLQRLDPASQEYHRAKDKFRILMSEISGFQADRVDARMEVEKLRFQAQLQFDLTLSNVDWPL
jgi:hypothetical protein